MGDGERGQLGDAPRCAAQPQAAQRPAPRRSPGQKQSRQSAVIASAPAARARPRRARPDESPWRVRQHRRVERRRRTRAAPSARGSRVVEMRHVRQAAAQHDHVGVEHVDDARQPARQPVGVAVERRLRAGVAGGRAGGDADRVQRRPVAVAVARREPGRRSRSPGSPRGRTSSAGPGISSRPRPGQRVVAPLAGDRVGGRAAAGRRSTTPPPQPVPRMTPNTTPRRRRRRRSPPTARSSWRRWPPAPGGRAPLRSRPSGRPFSAGGVGVLDQPGGGDDRARDADADRRTRRRARASIARTSPAIAASVAS